MNRNVKIAKELLKLAKSLVAADDGTEKEMKDFNTKCFKSFIDQKLKADGTTVNGEWSDSTSIGGKDVEVQMFTFSKNGKAEFKYHVSVGGKSFDDIVEADVSVPFTAKNTYDFVFDSEDNAKKFLDEYKESLTKAVGTAHGIDDAYDKAVAELAK